MKAVALRSEQTNQGRQIDARQAEIAPGYRADQEARVRHFVRSRAAVPMRTSRRTTGTEPSAAPESGGRGEAGRDAGIKAIRDKWWFLPPTPPRRLQTGLKRFLGFLGRPRFWVGLRVR